MNILYFPTYNYKLHVYNAASFWSEHLAALARLGTVHSVVLHPDVEELRSFRNLYSTGINGVGIPWKRHNRFPLKYFPAYGVSRSIIQHLAQTHKRIDLIYCQNASPFGNLAAALGSKLKVPVVLHEHTAFFLDRLSKTAHGQLRMGLHSYNDVLRIRALRRAGIVIVPSVFLRKQITKYTLRRTGIRIAYNPVQSCFMESNAEPVGLRKSPASVATWRGIKNLPRLVCAVNTLNVTRNVSLKVDIIGHVYPEVMKAVASSDLSAFNFVGEFPADRTLSHLSKAAYLILPSNLETFSLPVAEAMALGIPVVSTKCGAPEELLESGRGLLTGNSIPEFASGILQMNQNWKTFDCLPARKWVNSYCSSSAFQARIKKIVEDVFDS